MQRKKLQIFVSSTFIDLKEERQAAVEAILKAGHIPAGMELFTAGNQSQWRTIERWIAESDVYMLVLGGRYGSIEKSSGLRHTEKEYDYASKLGKPTFAVVITEEALELKVKMHGSTFIEPGYQKELDKFREKVLCRMSAFFSDTKDIKLCVHESLGEFSHDESLKGYVSAAGLLETENLSQEIIQLRRDNEKLKFELKILERKTEESASNGQLVELFTKIQINIPSKINNGISRTTSLLDVSYSQRHFLASGVTNSISCSEVEGFLFYEIIPRLQTHGLAETEKVVGAKYRRGFLNKRGLAFFAVLEARMLEKTQEKGKEPLGESDASKLKSASLAGSGAS